jgi:hypothetical protein
MTNIMKEELKKKKGFTFALGIGVGIILYKVIFEFLWPIIFK